MDIISYESRINLKLPHKLLWASNKTCYIIFTDATAMGGSKWGGNINK